MNATSLIFVVITSILLVIGWMAINKKDTPGGYRRNSNKPPQREPARRQ